MRAHISQESVKHTEMVLKAMREAMEKVPPEYRDAVTSRIYLKVGQRYHKKK